MKSQALAFSVILLLGTTLSGVRARPTGEIDVMYELGMLNMAMHGIFDDVYMKASKILTELSEIKLFADIRNYMAEIKDALAKVAEEFGKELEKELKKIKKEAKKEKRKHEETSQQKETPEPAQEN